jgi:hypothetical protein
VRDAQARAIRSILDEAYTRARRTLIAEMPRLRDVAAYLYEKERIDGDEFEAVMAGRLRSADGEGWRAAAASPRAWDAIPTTFQERLPAIDPAPPLLEAPLPVPIPLALAEPEAAPAPVPEIPPVTSDPPARPRRPRRRFIAHRRLPAMPGRLRRGVAAIMRELAEDTDR